MTRMIVAQPCRHTRFALIVSGTLAAAGVLMSPPAYAEGAKESRASARKPLSQTLTGEAKANFDAAKLLATDGDFSGALIKFQNAYDLSKDPRLLWNVAFCHKNLRHYAKVLSTLRRYVSEGGTLISATDRKEAEDLIQLIEPFTTRASIHVNEAGASITLDEEIVGESPLSAPVVLDIGERHLHVSKPGFLPFDKALAVGGSSDITLDVVLEKEVHEGKLVVNAPVNATVVLDAKPSPSNRLDLTLPSGAHKIVVTAPGMRPFQTEVVIQDKETRSLEVVLEPLAPSEKPKLSVAVGCEDGDPKAPEDGLAVYLDGPDALSASQVKRQWNEAEKRNIVQQVDYSVSPGAHRVRVSISDCHPQDANVTVDAKSGTRIEGALESDRFFLFKGPAGSPGWLRLGLGLWLSSGRVRASTPERYTANFGKMTGAAFDLGLVGRWFALYLDGAIGKGKYRRDSYNTHYALPRDAPASASQVSLRLGPRIPLNVVALGMGLGLGAQEVDLDAVRTGKKAGLGALYTQLDIQPLCDWGLFALAQVQKPFNDDSAFGSLQTGVFYQPNARCRREKSTPKELRTSAPHK